MYIALDFGDPEDPEDSEDSEDPEDLKDLEDSKECLFMCIICKKSFKSLQIFQQHKSKCRFELSKGYRKHKKMSKTEYIFPPTTVDKFTSAAARITPGYSDKSFHVQVQQEQEPKSEPIERIFVDDYSNG
ncbi:uncharacterized protein [Mytilus edulis]|uniref:uncharacterized protein n=1 Tax=Mytilus edulis TaxID=6550 RepID=UPI0039EEBFA6